MPDPAQEGQLRNLLSGSSLAGGGAAADTGVQAPVQALAAGGGEGGWGRETSALRKAARS